jgi:hypothetical protein
MRVAQSTPAEAEPCGRSSGCPQRQRLGKHGKARGDAAAARSSGSMRYRSVQAAAAAAATRPAAAAAIRAHVCGGLGGRDGGDRQTGLPQSDTPRCRLRYNEGRQGWHGCRSAGWSRWPSQSLAGIKGRAAELSRDLRVEAGCEARRQGSRAAYAGCGCGWRSS